MLNAYVHSYTVIKTGMIYSELYMNLAFFFITKMNGRDCKIENKNKNVPLKYNTYGVDFFRASKSNPLKLL